MYLPANGHCCQKRSEYSIIRIVVLVLFLNIPFLPVLQAPLLVVAQLHFNTLSGLIGKVVASHAAVACSSPAEVALSYTMHVALRGYCP